MQHLRRRALGFGTECREGGHYEAKDYIVRYKVAGDNDHNDTEPQSATSTITATEPVSGPYAVTAGDGPAWANGSQDELAITFKRTAEGGKDTTFAHFISASVDGNELTEPDDYTKAEGSVVITLTPAYIDSLAQLTTRMFAGNAFCDFVAQADTASPGTKVRPWEATLLWSQWSSCDAIDLTRGLTGGKCMRDHRWVRYW